MNGALLKGRNSEVVELSSGCICCTLQTSLLETLTTVHKNFNPKKIIIESSGVADPVAILPLLKEDQLQHWLQPANIITVLDAGIWQSREVLRRSPPTTSFKWPGSSLLNKIDTISKEEQSTYISELSDHYPSAEIVPTVECSIDHSWIWMPLYSMTHRHQNIPSPANRTIQNNPRFFQLCL